MSSSSASPVKSHGRRERLERSVFLWQLLLAVGVLILICILLVIDIDLSSEPLLLVGVAVIFLATMAASAVPWRKFPRRATMILPVLDIIGIGLIEAGEPSLGAALFLVFPVIWLATYYGLFGAILGPTFSSLVVGLNWLINTTNAVDTPTLLVLGIVFAFVSTASYLGTQKNLAQRRLLRQQAMLLEEAFDRTRRQERTLDEVINAVTFGVVAYDRSARPTMVNRAHRERLRQFGFDESEIVPEVVYREDRVTPFLEDERPHKRLARGESFDDVVMWYGDPGGYRMALAVTGRPLSNAAGQQDGSVWVSRDITAELEAIGARDDLVVSVSHELRTPLTSILGYLELVLDGDDLGEESRTHIEVALKNADRLLSLVSDLLVASHDDQVGFLLNFAPTDLAVIAKQSIQALKPVAEERKISLLLTTIGDPVVYADEFRVRQVIDNLLSNAVKYNNTGGRVSIAVIGDFHEVEIFVSDTGRGMTEEEQKNLFERFYRAESVRNTTIHGTGLGLSISREIARAHGGDVRMSASSPSGTTMVVTIPRENED
ncbi:HAMP domain-containing sensor histidine kinase [Mycetocola sp. 2940]|uniref:sensor histidine kinase n=1 Tax=Mycetocola sp. 2940 TaxID=3156452 RepID=UPI003397F8F2